MAAFLLQHKIYKHNSQNVRNKHHLQPVKGTKLQTQVSNDDIIRQKLSAELYFPVATIQCAYLCTKLYKRTAITKAY